MLITYQTKPCRYCHHTSRVQLDEDKFQAWQKGEYVQNVWPEKSPDDRELLITGTHPKCWDEMFGEGE